MENIMAKSTKKLPEPVNVIESRPAPEVATTTEAPTTTVEPVQLTIADLQLISRILDLASRRGAFQAGELSQVGDAYNKLIGFLNFVESSQKKEAEEKAAAE